jgi:hypothetical protein
MATQKQEELEFSIVLAKELAPNTRTSIVAELASRLIRAATSLHRRYEAACSYEWACTEAYERGTERKEDAVRKMLAPHGIACEFGSDPRGAPVTLKLKSGRTNNWNSDGYCVPTREGR